MEKKTQKLFADGTKVLLVYCSRSGNTREIARRIHQIVGGDIVEIEPAAPYPDDYNAVVKQAGEMRDTSQISDKPHDHQNIEQPTNFPQLGRKLFVC